VTRVQLQHEGRVVAQHEIDAVEPDEAEGSRRRLHDRVEMPEEPIAYGKREQAATVPVPAGAERGLAGQAARDAEEDSPAPVGEEGDRSWQSIDALLEQLATGRPQLGAELADTLTSAEGGPNAVAVVDPQPGT
jgi:hypothetical protein